MFQLQGTIIRPLYNILSGFWCAIVIAVVYITGVLLCAVFWFGYKWKTIFSKWSIVLKCTIKLELSIKLNNCSLINYKQLVINLGFIH
jgi:hypothetical protein